MSSGPHTAKIAELRRQAGLIEQTIAALEILNGDRPMPAPTETYTATLDRPSARKLLSAAKPKAPRAKQRPTSVESKTTMRVLALRPNKEADETAVLAAVRKLGPTTCSDVVQATKLPAHRVKRAKARLQKQGQLVVTGWAHGSRWSLPRSAKEAP